MNLFLVYALIGLLVLVFWRLRKRDDTHTVPQTDGMPGSGFRSAAIPLAAAAAMAAAAAGNSHAHAGNSNHEFHDSDDDDDWITDPLYSHMPGNIYHHDDTGIGCGHDSSDWMTDPSCSWMSGNIYHHDDAFDSSSGIGSSDDSWSSTSSFDDSWSSSGGISHDDDW